MKQKTISNEFDQYCDRILKKYKVPGFSMGLALNGDMFYEKQSGFRDIEEELPLSADTIYGIASITKSVTGIAILQLQEQRKLSVNDPVTKYLPEFKTPSEKQTRQITIHHFLTHTSGIPPLPTLYKAMKKSMKNDSDFAEENEEAEGQENTVDDIPEINTYVELMDSIGKSDFTLLGPVGTEFSYSNDAYGLLGAVIERVSGLSYKDYVIKYILEPAGMHHSGFDIRNLKKYKDIASLYTSTEKDGERIVVKSDNHWDAPAMLAAGDLKSTVNDMLRYTEIFLNDGKVDGVKILSSESLKLMTTPHVQCDSGVYYGYGVMITPDFYGYKLIDHGGSSKGVAAQMNIIPELGLSGISLANLNGIPSTKLLFSAFANYFEKPMESSHSEKGAIDLSLVAIKEPEGSFKSDEGLLIELSEEKGELIFKTAGLPDSPLKPVEKDLFLLNMREMDFSVRMLRDKDHTINRIAFGYRQMPRVRK